MSAQRLTRVKGNSPKLGGSVRGTNRVLAPTLSGAWNRILREARCQSRPLHEMRSPLQSLHALWADKRGARAFPSKADLVPKAIKHLLRHVGLIRMFGGGNAFEVRIAGDALVQGFGQNIHGRRVTDLAQFGPVLESTLRSVASGGSPHLLEFQYASAGQNVVCGQAVFLPLGESDGEVDHILVMGTVVPLKHGALQPGASLELLDLGIRKFAFYPKPLEQIGDHLLPLQKLWNERRGQRRFPARDAISPRDIKDYLARATIMRVIDGGNDFEYLLAGDVLIKSYGSNLQGAKASELANLREVTDLSALMDVACRPVVAHGAPILVEFKSELYGGAIVRREALHLPLGDDDGAVDHILVVSSPAVRL